MKKLSISIGLIIAIVFSGASVIAGKKQLLNLKDVTGGQEVRGVVHDRLVNGGVKAVYEQDTQKYSLTAEFVALKDPVGDDFYEGWLVRPEPFDFVSTGKVEKDPTRKVYLQEFNDIKDLSEYTQYVLTVEPNDGDPAPADHILEGQVRLRTLSVGKTPKWSKIGIKTPVVKNTTKPKVTKSLSRDGFYGPLKARLENVSVSRLEKLQSQIPAVQARFQSNASLSPEKRERILVILATVSEVIDDILK